MSNVPAVPLSKVLELGYRPRDIALAQTMFPTLDERQLVVLFLTGARAGLNPALGQLVWIDRGPFITSSGLQVIASRRMNLIDKLIEWSKDGEEWKPVPIDGSEFCRCRLVYTTPIDLQTQRIATSVVSLREFVPQRRDGLKPGDPWARMPSHMLGKVAYAHALREAAPLEMGGLYSVDEAPSFTNYDGEHVDDDMEGEYVDEMG